MALRANARAAYHWQDWTRLHPLENQPHCYASPHSLVLGLNHPCFGDTQPGFAVRLSYQWMQAGQSCLCCQPGMCPQCMHSLALQDDPIDATSSSSC